MHRSLFAILGLAAPLLCVAANADDVNCPEAKTVCTASEQAKQPASTGPDAGSTINLVNTKDPSMSLKLSSKDIDDLFQSDSTEKRTIPSKAAARDAMEDSFSAKDFELGVKIARAARVDCRQKYVSPEPNLLLIIPLLIETVTDRGCKW